ncbi:MAG: YbjQ family protein [Cyanothece sp. SIO2G6]|nr:YbjQ family protein [Cyanothece sp. SIO2G6]
MGDLIVVLILLAIGYGFGSYAERQHYKSIREREKATLHVPIMTFGAKQSLPPAKETALFVGSVVVASDYFKTFALALRNLVGGRVLSYESLLDRGRREALLRMKEEAIAWGATELANVRINTSSLSQGGQGMISIEVIAYGTGIR